MNEENINKTICPSCEGQGYIVQPYPIFWPATREMAMDGCDLSLEGSPVYIGDEYEQIICEFCNGIGFLSNI